MRSGKARVKSGRKKATYERPGEILGGSAHRLNKDLINITPPNKECVLIAVTDC